eukprot:TRINITY_DN33567_c0_g1_i1.p1 TRINITY_DN33567_c0_g1~~TRINITY_DN33567_c0_g1_i1.p1  ORF type:complete len:613 (+),score=133.41 TRINITY_DN33567_c0_g1_i1:58-1896(+)
MRPQGDVESQAAPVAFSAFEEKKQLDVLLSFKFFRELDAGVQRLLASIVQSEKLSAGTVLFRQGDPPGSSFVLMEGSVGIFMTPPPVEAEGTTGKRVSLSRTAFAEEDDSRHGTPRQGLQALLLNGGRADSCDDDGRHGSAQRSSKPAPEDTRQALHRASKGTANLSRRSSKATTAGTQSRRGSTTQEAVSDALATIKRLVRTPTYEGFSVYHSESKLGNQVATLKAGSLFGELALLNDQPRSASIKCMEDCEFLVVRRDDFDALLKNDLQQKKNEQVSFLRAHVPGMNDITPGTGKTHPSYLFQRASFSRGHVFLKQGQAASEAVWVVYKGAVEFWHTDPETEPKGGYSGSTSRVRSASAGRLRPASAGSQLEAASRRGAVPGKGRRVGVLLSGGVFGAMPTADVEPFTVEVQSPCEVLFISKAEMMRLPKRLVSSMCDYLVHSTMWRLSRCMEGRMPLPSLLTEGEAGAAPAAKDRELLILQQDPLQSMSSCPAASQTLKAQRPLTTGSLRARQNQLQKAEEGKVFSASPIAALMRKPLGSVLNPCAAKRPCTAMSKSSGTLVDAWMDMPQARARARSSASIAASAEKRSCSHGSSVKRSSARATPMPIQ